MSDRICITSILASLLSFTCSASDGYYCSYESPRFAVCFDPWLVAAFQEVDSVMQYPQTLAVLPHALSQPDMVLGLSLM